MIEMTTLELVLKAFGCIMFGAMIGIVVMAACAANKISEMRDALARARKDAKDWHDFWQKINNTLDEYRTHARALKVCINGKGGKRTWVSAHDAIVAKQKGAGHA